MSRTFTLDELKNIYREYLLSIKDDGLQTDWYSTARGFAEVEIDKFLAFVEETELRNKKESAET